MKNLSERPQNLNFGKNTPKVSCIICRKEMGVNAWPRHTERRCEFYLGKNKKSSKKSGKKQAWNKGLSKHTDYRVAQQAKTYKNRYKLGQITQQPKASDEQITYRNNCKFKFNVFNYPKLFDLDLLKIHGWYHPIKNPNGISRDHRVSIKYGWLNNISPKYMSHPYNCELLLHVDNTCKKTNNSIGIDELMNLVDNVPMTGKATVQPAKLKNEGLKPSWHFKKSCCERCSTDFFSKTKRKYC